MPSFPIGQNLVLNGGKQGPLAVELFKIWLIT